jgi:CRISPR-associated protein Cas2
MFFVVAYDIVDDRRRTRLSKALKDFGTRVQYSVFECLMGPGELDKMSGRISDIIDQEEDTVRIYTLCPGCEARVDIIGTGGRTEDPGVYIL